MKYDRQTLKIINKFVKKDSICVDIGCHLGEILDIFIKNAPHKNHYAFEPLPNFYEHLKTKYDVNVFPYALSKESNELEFNCVMNAPEYSGLKKRSYFGVKNPKITLIKVKTEKLDDIIPKEVKVDFIKIDVEGAEYDVLLGAKRVILESNPIILFEFGIGASEFYLTTPKMMFDLLHREYKMEIFSLDNFLNQKEAYNQESFISCYENSLEFYFVAK